MSMSEIAFVHLTFKCFLPHRESHHHTSIDAEWENSGTEEEGGGAVDENCPGCYTIL